MYDCRSPPCHDPDKGVGGAFKPFADVTLDCSPCNPFRSTGRPPCTTTKTPPAPPPSTHTHRLPTRKPAPVKRGSKAEAVGHNKAGSWASDAASMDELFNNHAWTRMGMKECARLNPQHPESHRHVLDVHMPPLLAGVNSKKKSLGNPTAGEFCLGYILHKNRQAHRRKQQLRLRSKKMPAAVSAEQKQQRPEDDGVPLREKREKREILKKKHTRNPDPDLWDFFDPGRQRQRQRQRRPPPPPPSQTRRPRKKTADDRGQQTRFKPSGDLVVDARLPDF